MNRNQRIAARQRRRADQADSLTARLARAMKNAGISAGEQQDFLDWVVAASWNTLKEQRMNQRIIIEDEIRRLGIRFPNGTVRKDYSFSFRLPSGSISDIKLDGAEELGLTFQVDPEGECTLSGRPGKPGDFTLHLRYRTVKGEPVSEHLIPIAFNPDPRSLWRNKPTDKDIPYYKEDFAMEYVKVAPGADGIPRKNMVGVSQRGRSHAQEGKPRDDHFALRYCEESGWYIMAVADGAGSAKYSRKGSEVACKTVVEHCQKLLRSNPELERAISEYAADRTNVDKRTALTRFVTDITFNGARKAHEAIKKVTEVNDDGTRMKDFATTLMFAVCKKYDFGWFITTFWVGDGAMCLYDAENGKAHLLGTPDEGEFSGQTRFLTMPEIFRDKDILVKRVKMAIIPDFTALYLMTDGVSDPMFETERNLNDFGKWEEFSRKLATGFPDDEIEGVELRDDNEDVASRLLGWLDFWSPGNHDDRTIAILY